MYRMLTGPIRWVAAWLALVLLAGGVLPGAERPGLARPAAAPQSLPFDVTAGGALWESIDNAFCESVTAFQIDDAELLATGQNDAYDNAFCMIVNGTPFVAPDPVDLTGTTVTAEPVTIAGLSVTQQFFFLTTLPVVRVLASFTNPTAAPITATVAFETDLGSDSATVVVASSSGDTTFTTADRWVITADSPTDPVGDPAILHVFRGPGSPSVTPSAAGLGLEGNGCSVSVPGDPEARCVAFT